MSNVSEKRLIDLACSDMDSRPELCESESMARELLELRAAQRNAAHTLAWQGSPSESDYVSPRGRRRYGYIEGKCSIHMVRQDALGRWTYASLHVSGVWKPLGKLRFCPLPPPPPLPKRGDE